MTAQTPSQAALIALARRLPLSVRRELEPEIVLLEKLLGLPHELTLDQRKQVAGTNGKSPHAIRRANDRSYFVESRATKGGEFFTLEDAAFLLGLAPQTLKMRACAGREVARSRLLSPWTEGADLLTCTRLPDATQWPLKSTTIAWIARERAAKARRAESYQRTHQATQAA